VHAIEVGTVQGHLTEPANVVGRAYTENVHCHTLRSGNAMSGLEEEQDLI
jgi:hypothetical protein